MRVIIFKCAQLAPDKVNLISSCRSGLRQLREIFLPDLVSLVLLVVNCDQQLRRLTQTLHASVFNKSVNKIASLSLYLEFEMI